LSSVEAAAGCLPRLAGLAMVVGLQRWKNGRRRRRGKCTERENPTDFEIVSFCTMLRVDCFRRSCFRTTHPLNGTFRATTPADSSSTQSTQLMPQQKSTEKKHGAPGFRSCKAVPARESWKIPLSKIETGATVIGINTLNGCT